MKRLTVLLIASVVMSAVAYASDPPLPDKTEKVTLVKENSLVASTFVIEARVEVIAPVIVNLPQEVSAYRMKQVPQFAERSTVPTNDLRTKDVYLEWTGNHIFSWS